MDPATTLIRSASARLGDLLASADPTAAVPTCPAWTSRDLLRHLVGVHGFWSQILERRAVADADLDPIEEEPPDRGEDVADLRSQLERATARLTAVLDARDDDEAAWSWFAPDQTVGFTRRMQLHEATIHAVDAALTAGVAVPEPAADLSGAGIDHCTRVMWAAMREWSPDWAGVEVVAQLDLVPSDGPTRTVVISRATGTSPTSGEPFAAIFAEPHGAGTSQDASSALPRAAARGTSAGLYLWSWGRGAALEALEPGAQTVLVDGAPLAVAAVEELLAQGLE